MYAWDWLNMYFYEFKMIPKKVNEKEVYFSIFLQSDSRLFTTNQPDNLSTFDSPEDSFTRLVFAVSNKELVYEDIYDDKDIGPEVNKYQVRINEGNIVILVIIDIQEFINEEAAIKQLENINGFCKKNKIEIQDETNIA